MDWKFDILEHVRTHVSVGIRSVEAFELSMDVEETKLFKQLSQTECPAQPTSRTTVTFRSDGACCNGGSYPQNDTMTSSETFGVFSL